MLPVVGSEHTLKHINWREGSNFWQDDASVKMIPGFRALIMSACNERFNKALRVGVMLLRSLIEILNPLCYHAFKSPS